MALVLIKSTIHVGHCESVSKTWFLVPFSIFKKCNFKKTIIRVITIVLIKSTIHVGAQSVSKTWFLVPFCIFKECKPWWNAAYCSRMPYFTWVSSLFAIVPMGGSRGGTGDPDPPEKSQKYSVFFSNTGPEPLKNQTSIQCWAIIGRQRNAILLGHHRPARETPFKWRFAGGPMMAHFLVVFGSSLPHYLKKKRCQSWTPSGKTFWIRAWVPGNRFPVFTSLECI